MTADRVKRSDIPTQAVLEAVIAGREYLRAVFRPRPGEPKPAERVEPAALLAREFGCAEKVAYAAMEREVDRDLLEYGVSIRYPWLTEKGEAFMLRVGVKPPEEAVGA